MRNGSYPKVIILKECLEELAIVITSITNASLNCAYVPKSFKLSRIKLHLKKPNLDSNVLKHYRPMLNPSFLSMVLENVVDVRIENHLRNNALHEFNQSIYRKFHSTETALIKVRNDVLIRWIKKEGIFVIFDLSAAFDTIDHGTLIHRLERFFGISGKCLAWMQSYLTERYQTVCIDGELSQPVHMK